MLNNIKERAINFIKENKWILLSSLFFIGWKFFLISVLFGHEWSRGEEAQAYIYHINSIIKCSSLFSCKDFLSSFDNYFGFEHLSYRLFFGFIGHLFKMDSSSVFHLSFYIGVLILLPSLIVFLKNIETDKKLIAFLLFFLALYNGGRYHGFWWIVPGFFAVLLIFLIFAIILGKYKHWKILLSILIPLGLYTHMLFVYLMITPIFFYIFYSYFMKKIDIAMLKKIVFSVFILFIFYLPTSYYLNEDNPYGIKSFIVNSNIVNFTTKSLSTNGISPSPPPKPTPSPTKQTPHTNRNLLPGFMVIKDGYFDWIFLNLAFVIIFIHIVFVSFYYKQYKILSLYFAALIFTLTSSINEHADRSLVFIWPITFLLYAYGVWFSFKLNDELTKNKLHHTIIKIFLYLGLFFFIIINLVYSYGINTDLLFGLQKFINTHVWNNW